MCGPKVNQISILAMCFFNSTNDMTVLMFSIHEKCFHIVSHVICITEASSIGDTLYT